MYVESLLNTIDCTKSMMCDIRKILTMFIDLERKNSIKYVDLNYFLFETNINKKDLYYIFHLLIDIGIIEKKIFSICPTCLYENIFIESKEIIKCNRCNNYFNEEMLIEKFALKEGLDL